MTDHELIKRIKGSDDIGAFDVLFRRYYKQALALASALLHDQEMARDVAQDVFVRLWTGRDKLDEERSVKALIITSIRNASINVLKGRHTVSFSALDSVPEPATDNTSRELRLNDTSKRINEIVEAMPPVRRRVYLMSREEGRDSDSIAAELGISRRTVDKHIELALKDLRQNLS